MKKTETRALQLVLNTPRSKEAVSSVFRRSKHRYSADDRREVCS